MFEFISFDSEKGIDRIKRFEISILIYAFSKFKTRKEIAEYCGISTKTINNRIRQYPNELGHLKKRSNIERVINRERVKAYYGSKLWKKTN